MDCFYAAVEMRDDPSLIGKPIAVGGGQTRSVVATCDYEARKFGVHSAMSGIRAQQLCPHIVFVRPNFDKYRAESRRIRGLMKKYTDLIEPLSLDEAYMDVTDCPLHNNSATLVARALKKDIYAETGLKSSAGVAPNKFLAKIASDWEKPDGLTVITPARVADFVRVLPLSRIPGVGRVTQAKLAKLGWHNCGDLQQRSLEELRQQLGKFGEVLHQRAFGRDERPVVTARLRKSLSVENTYHQDLESDERISKAITQLLFLLEERLNQAQEKKPIKGIFVKVKFADFTLTTKQASGMQLSAANLIQLCQEARQRHNKAVRLLGVGVDFVSTAQEAVPSRSARSAKSAQVSQPSLI